MSICVQQDAAVAKERYGDFLLCDMKDEEAAAYAIRKAVGLFTEWGAIAKVDQLSEKYSTLLNRSPFREVLAAQNSSLQLKVD